MAFNIKDEICSWIGKRWIHGQSVKSEGADCIQFIVAVAKTAGWIPQDYKTIKYARDWAIHNDKSILKEEIKKHASLVILDSNTVMSNLHKLQVGDIILIISGQTSGHAGFYIGDGNIVHSHIRHGILQEKLSVYNDKIDSVWRINKE